MLLPDHWPVVCLCHTDTINPLLVPSPLHSLQVSIELNEPVSQTFACHYVGHFIKATPLSDRVVISLKDGQPMCLQYPIGAVGHLQYFLAPKVTDDSNE